MASSSQVQIVNRALQKLGATRISSMTQNHPNARSMSAAYDPVRRKLLRSYQWSFAKKRASVPALSTQTVFGGLYQYPVPTDFIQLLRSNLPDGPFGRNDWEIENGNIITSDGSPLQFRYIADITDPGQFDPYFAEALACVLAYECCDEITGSVEKRQMLQKDMQAVLREARYANAFERDADVPNEDDWVLAMQSYTAGPVITGQAV